MKLTYEDLIILLSNNLSIQKSEAEEKLNSWVEQVQSRLKEKGSYKVVGLGSFVKKDDKVLFSPEPALETEVNYKYAGMKPIEIHSSAANKKEISAKEAAETIKDSEMADSKKSDPSKKSGDKEKDQKQVEESSKSQAGKKSETATGKKEEPAPAKSSSDTPEKASGKKDTEEKTEKEAQPKKKTPAAAKQKKETAKDSGTVKSGEKPEKEDSKPGVRGKEEKKESDKKNVDESVAEKSSDSREGTDDKGAASKDRSAKTDLEDLPGVTSKKAASPKPSSRWRGKKEPEKMESEEDPFADLEELHTEKPREVEMDNTDVFGMYDDEFGKEKAEPLVKKSSGSGKKTQSRSVVSGSGPGKIRSRRGGGMPGWLWAIPVLAALGLGVYLFFYYTESTSDSGYSTSDVSVSGRLDTPEETYVYEEAEDLPAAEEETAVPDVTEEPAAPEEPVEEVITEEPAEETVQPAVEETVPASERDADSSVYGLRGPVDEVLTGSFSIVVHSIPSETRARAERDRLMQDGYKATMWQNEMPDGSITWRVGLGQFESIADAEAAIPQLNEPYQSNNFIARVR
ncbi:SPOR domain-containing protein [Balneolaceae bacterium ANBcel3]|nr:SPOR domain-containing protein [Balneolaceae bacterium ANBcel3]